ncbi:MAG TPA: hypothetical protein PKC43_01320 [Phycisphaerales bacterium]|nr:hypothetical protein [Phycisphaerales bacterium]HMP36065.1 hypothetical protein [Phycisphaerales bacterium]
MIAAYCTNVHPGASLDESLATLRRDAGAVRALLVAAGDLERSAPLGIGWWLPAAAAASLVERREGEALPRVRSGAIAELRAALAAEGLRIATFNAFPHGDFHGAVVKRAVYSPDWSEPERLKYTLDVAAIAAELAPEGASMGISTLPLAWHGSHHPALRRPASAAAASESDALPRRRSESARDAPERGRRRPVPSAPAGGASGSIGVAAEPEEAGLRDQVVRQSAAALAALTESLAALRMRSGVRVHVDLEPEPGCLLQRSADVATFVAQHLRPAARARGVDETTLADHVGICHDTCHAAVMGESQSAALATYAATGLRLGKVQLSSALRVDFDALPFAERPAARAALGRFAEARYLHQTILRRRLATAQHGRDERDEELRFYEDLPDAIAALSDPVGECRVHFHVPIHLDRVDAALPALRTTREELIECLDALPAGSTTLEVETYAWGVLPGGMRPASLAEGIATELRWLRGELSRRGWDAPSAAVDAP